MKEDKTPWVISFILSIVLFLLILFVVVKGVRNRIDVNQPLQDTFLNLSAGKSITQSFTAKHDFINIVILNFKNPGLKNHGQFRFLLLSEKGKSLVERLFSGYNIGDPSQIRFQFDPIQSSKNKNFTLLVEAISLDEPQIGIGASKEGDLNFSLYYRVASRKAALSDFLNNLTKYFLNDKSFFIPWGLLVIFLAGLGVRDVLKIR